MWWTGGYDGGDDDDDDDAIVWKLGNQLFIAVVICV